MDKVIDIEERIPSMREKRRRKTNKKFLFVLSVFVVALLAILYFQSPLSKVGMITVSGAMLHDSEILQRTKWPSDGQAPLEFQNRRN